MRSKRLDPEEAKPNLKIIKKVKTKVFWLVTEIFLSKWIRFSSCQYWMQEVVNSNWQEFVSEDAKDQRDNIYSSTIFKPKIKLIVVKYSSKNRLEYESRLGLFFFLFIYLYYFNIFIYLFIYFYQNPFRN